MRILLVIITMLFSSATARAAWTKVPALDESSFLCVAVDPMESRIIYGATDKRLYRSADEGASWKRVLSLRGQDRIRHVFVDPTRPGSVYVAGQHAVRVTEDGGKNWREIFRAPDDAVFCVARSQSGDVWIGTGKGLFVLGPASAPGKLLSLPDSSVQSIAFPDAKQALVATAKGIYSSDDNGASWRRVYFEPQPEETSSGAIGQFQIEEFSLEPTIAALVAAGTQGPAYAASTKGLIEGFPGEDSWSLEPSTAGRSVEAVALGGNGLYFASAGRVYRRAEDSDPSDISTGLEGAQVRHLAVSPAAGDIWAATDRGLFVFHENAALPDGLRRVPETNFVIPKEPGIREIQEAAVRYAEVHPDKIESWRRAAARKAFFPKVSVGANLDSNENVDLDRGGTGDPDRFIQGPQERSKGWDVGLSWDLGEMIWNPDQTSIDVRSKLMVELRDDVLAETTQLYFERRRLQIELSRSPEDAVRWQKQLKLEELTARIDALTGGYLSRSVAEKGAPHAVSSSGS